jgi:secreted trypsin-like serine protease
VKQNVVVVVGCVLCVLASSCGGESRESLFVQDQSAIIGGTATTALPAVGLITYGGNALCTGTLIEPTKVLTAGHCVTDVSAGSLNFVIGPTTSDIEEVLAVKSIQPHPSFSMTTVQNDIGIMILAKAASVAPMKVNSTAMTSSWVGNKLVFVGYGVNDGYDQTGDGVKRAVEIPIAGVHSTTFSYGGSGKNTCNGDSGGPAFVEDADGNLLVAGVTSYGDQYCTTYGVDTRVDAYQSFLGSASGTTPPPTDLPPATTDGCQGETFDGRCSGNQLIWCENNQVKVANCKNQCGWDTSNQYYNCL